MDEQNMDEQNIPSLEIEPISRLTLALFAGASGDHNPIHIDLDYAKAAGMEDVFAHGMLSMAYMGRMLTNWIPASRLREFGVRFMAITHVHDRITCSGRVVEKFERDGEALVRVELKAVNQKGETTLAGEAVVAL
jgi:acyl dehydratase